MKLVIALISSLAFFFCFYDGVLGDDRWYLLGAGQEPGIVLNQQRALEQTGVWRTCYVQESAGANIQAAVNQALREWQEVGQFGIAYDCAADSNFQIATGGNAFIYGNGQRAGCGFGATACLSEYGRNVNVVYNAAAMSLWTLRSQTGVVLHEVCHAMADCGEQYAHTSGIFCTGKPWTVMDCGIGHALFIQDFDRELFRKFHAPDVPSAYGFRIDGDWVTLTWSQLRHDTGKVNQQATRMAFAVAFDGGPIQWVGDFCGPAFDYCYSPYSAGYRGFGGPFWMRPGACYFLHAENAMWALPQTSAPAFWTWMGCV